MKTLFSFTTATLIDIAGLVLNWFSSLEPTRVNRLLYGCAVLFWLVVFYFSL